MAFLDKFLPRDKNKSVANHYYNPTADNYEVIEGSGGAPFVKLTGSYVRLAAEPKPTAADGVKDGNDLFLIDTQEVFIYYSGEWRAI